MFSQRVTVVEKSRYKKKKNKKTDNTCLIRSAVGNSLVILILKKVLLNTINKRCASAIEV